MTIALRFVLSKIDVPDLNLKREFLDELREPYYQLMVNFAVIFGANRTRAELEMNETLSFEMLLLKVRIPISW